MQTRLAPELKEIIGKIPFLPAITIVMPYNPKMDTGRSNSREFITAVKKKVNAMVVENYYDDLGIIVLKKLDRILGKLNSSTPYESVAIFLSPVFEKTLYLNYPVNTHISIEENFSIRQAVFSKKNIIRYLVLDLTSDKSRLCFGNEKGALVIKTDTCISQKNIALFNRTDKEIGLLAETYKVPLFVVGNKSNLRFFEERTCNSQHIVKYIPAALPLSLQSLWSLLNLYFSDWDSILDRYSTNQIKKAAQTGNMVCGINNVMLEAAHRQPRKLYISQLFANEYNNTTRQPEIAGIGDRYSRYSYIKNSLDELIEQILQSGGQVDLIKDNSLDSYHNICLIYK